MTQNSSQIRIAALLTCHNRCVKTLECLRRLYNQTLPKGAKLSVYLVDDGSTDGTSEAVRQNFPQVILLSGNGQLFWNGGMRVAFTEAIKSNFDFYLWINDDTMLYTTAINTLIETFNQLSKGESQEIIVVGSTCDAETKILTYGGLVRKNWWHPFQFKSVEPGDTAKRCLTMNGNCVMIPAGVMKKVGNLDPAFTHYAGDVDYGLRAKQKRCQVWISPGFIGTCSRNNLTGSMAPELSPKERLKKMKSPKEFSFQERRIFAQRHGGLFWILFWLLPYRNLLSLKLLSRSA